MVNIKLKTVLGCADVEIMSASLEFSGQPLELLIDINSAETVLIKKGVREGTNEGYNTTEAGDDYKPYRDHINTKFDDDINDHFSEVWGTIGQATVANCTINDTVTFAVIDKLNGDPSTILKNSRRLSGRIGLNPWQDNFTNGTTFLLGEKRQDLVFMSFCANKK